ncbi:MAG: PKD domain-containing protein [Candidatus Aenigmarchaeota archaeon]|nr:PKD domain-containing protein [Candidatus Aenigmarchaeota archaeon]
MKTIISILSVFTFILLIAPVYAVEVELTDTEFIIANVSASIPDNSILNASASPVQSDPSTQGYIVDIEFNVTDVTANTPNSSVLDASASPIQLNPSTLCHIADAEFGPADADVSSPGSAVLDASYSPVQLDPSNQTYIIDTEFVVADEPELKEQSMAILPVFFPVSSFIYTSTGLTVFFNSTSYDPYGYPIQSYYWNFGDGGMSVIPNPNHTYSMRGDYPVRLIVTDIRGYKISSLTVISFDKITITRVIYPKGIPFGTELIVEVDTNIETDITINFDTFHQVKYGTHAVFNIDTNTLHKGEHQLTISAGEDTYKDRIVIYDPPVFQSITKGIDDLGTCSKDELSEISTKMGSALAGHVYAILLGQAIDGDVTAGDVLNELRETIDKVSDIMHVELETFKNILISINPAFSEIVGEMDRVNKIIVNIQNAIDNCGEMITDENIVENLNEYVMEPVVYSVICTYKENMIDARTQNAKRDLYSSYPQDRAERINEVLLIGRSSIKNTGGEEIYKLYLGDVLDYEISSKPTLDIFAERQEMALNPPDDLCVHGYCIPDEYNPIPGKYNPIWLFGVTLAAAESLLVVPASLEWISPLPDENEDEIQLMVEPVFTPLAIKLAILKATKVYVSCAEAIGFKAPFVIDGGMVLSVDILAKRIDDKHEDVIGVVYDIAQAYSGGVSVPMSVNGGLYVPEGNILVATSPDGKIVDFKYVQSDSVVSMPKNRNLVSLNTGWFQSFDAEPQNILISVDADNFSYNVGDVVNLTINVSSDVFIEDAMLWVFVPKANTTIKDIINVTVGNTVREYNFTIYNEMWHVPRVYLANFGTILAENYTSISVGSESNTMGLVMVDSNEFYDPGTVYLNVTVHNTGNTQINSKLDYFGVHPAMMGQIEIPALGIGEQVTEQLTFELTAPDNYEMYFVLNSSSGVLDYNVARFTVTAIDTLLAFPMTDMPIYNLDDDVNITVTVKNITLDIVDFPYALSVMTPAGDVVNSLLFMPEHNGTYIVKAKPIAEGYCVVEGETLFIVEKQSSLEIETDTIGNVTVITVRTDVGGAVDGADIIVNGYALKTDENGTVEFSSFNVTQLIIRAEKFGFNPDLVSVDLGVSVFNLSLNEGWNLISLPLQLVNTSMFSVFPPNEVNYTSVWTYYGGSWKRYDFESPFPHLNDLYDVEAGKGYWINMENADVVTIRGSLAASSVYLTTGWNLVGYNALASQSVTDAMSSIEGNYTSVWQYENGDWDRYDLESPFPHLNDLDLMGSGYGYWININSTGCDWVI